MDQCTLELSITIRQMEKEDIFILMDLSMKDKLKVILLMDMENILITVRSTHTKANGLMISLMEKEYKHLS